MSNNTWKEEFYPIKASDRSLKTNLMRVQHSLQKWRGLRKEELERHGIVPVTNFKLQTKQGGDFVLHIDDRSCALCERYSYNNQCQSCPLSRVRSGYSCDSSKPNEDMPPWRAWSFDQNPEPMIAVLEKAEKALLREQARCKRAKDRDIGAA